MAVLAGLFDQQVTIGILPDDILLELFGFYLDESAEHEQWFTLAHVCQRWRHVVSASPRRLNLQLVCTGYTPPGEMLAEWPALPIHIDRFGKSKGRAVRRMSMPEVNNVLAALKHNNRVSKIIFRDVGNKQLRHSLADMQEPFPMLDYLDIRDHPKFYSRVPAVFPDSFLGGSAPLLVHLGLARKSFPGLPKLLLSANRLVDIYLWDIPYIPPEIMAASLSAMKHLQSLVIGIRTSSHQASQRPHSVTRIALPALNSLTLACTDGYMEDLVARLDAPSLELMDISVIHLFQVFTFSEESELPQFISRIKAFIISDQVQLFASPKETRLTISQKTSRIDLADAAELSLTFMGPPEILFSALPPLHFERVEIYEDRFIIRNPQLNFELELRGFSRRFTAAKDLFLDPRATVLVEAGLLDSAEETVAELFPALQNIFMEDCLLTPPTNKGFLKFTTARRLAGLPVTVHSWDMEPRKTGK